MNPNDHTQNSDHNDSAAGQGSNGSGTGQQQVPDKQKNPEELDRDKILKEMQEGGGIEILQNDE
jgi:hypothetical protein